jgi:hypothetical protein
MQLVSSRRRDLPRVGSGAIRRPTKEPIMHTLWSVNTHCAMIR